MKTLICVAPSPTLTISWPGVIDPLWAKGLAQVKAELEAGQGLSH